MSQSAKVYLTEGVSDELRQVGRSSKDQLARIHEKIRLLEEVGWVTALEIGLVVKLKGYSMHEIKVPGKGPSYRLLCNPLKGRDGRIIIAASCLPKNSLIKRLAMKSAVHQAENRIAAWKNQNPSLLR